MYYEETRTAFIGEEFLFRSSFQQTEQNFRKKRSRNKFTGTWLTQRRYLGRKTVDKFIVPDGGDKVNPMPESTISPVRDYEFGYLSSKSTDSGKSFEIQVTERDMMRNGRKKKLKVHREHYSTVPSNLLISSGGHSSP